MTSLDNYDKLKVAVALEDIFSLLSPQEQERFISSMHVRRYNKNELIYREGDQPDDLLCLLSGKVKIYRDGVSGRTLINRVLRPVQYFGYRASMAGEPYVTAAAAFEESVIASVPMRTVYQLLEGNNRLCHFFIHALAVDLGIADQRIVSVAQKHVRGRLAETLLALHDIYGCESDGQTLSAYLSRGILASLSNMTTSNAIRTLTTFANEGILEVRGRRLRFLDMQALLQISENG